MALVGVAGLAMSGIGMGMSYSQNKSAAANANAMAEYNYAVERNNIANQQKTAQWQAQQAAKQQEAQAAMAMNTANANAANLEQQAGAAERRGTEDQRRTREDQLRMSSIQNARIAKSGVAATGTPVEVLAETGRNMQLALSDSWYETNSERSSLIEGAAMERYGGSVGAAGYGMGAAAARAEGSLAPMKARQQLRSAQIERLSGLNNASGMKSAATAGLVSGMGTILGQGYNMYPKAKPGTGGISYGAGYY